MLRKSFIFLLIILAIAAGGIYGVLPSIRESSFQNSLQDTLFPGLHIENTETSHDPFNSTLQWVSVFFDEQKLYSARDITLSFPAYAYNNINTIRITGLSLPLTENNITTPSPRYNAAALFEMLNQFHVSKLQLDDMDIGLLSDRFGNIILDLNIELIRKDKHFQIIGDFDSRQQHAHASGKIFGALSQDGLKFRLELESGKIHDPDFKINRTSGTFNTTESSNSFQAGSAQLFGLPWKTLSFQMQGSLLQPSSWAGQGHAIDNGIHFEFSNDKGALYASSGENLVQFLEKGDHQIILPDDVHNLSKMQDIQIDFSLQTPLTYTYKTQQGLTIERYFSP